MSPQPASSSHPSFLGSSRSDPTLLICPNTYCSTQMPIVLSLVSSPWHKDAWPTLAPFLFPLSAFLYLSLFSFLLPSFDKCFWVSVQCASLCANCQGSIRRSDIHISHPSGLAVSVLGFSSGHIFLSDVFSWLSFSEWSLTFLRLDGSCNMFLAMRNALVVREEKATGDSGVESA